MGGSAAGMGIEGNGSELSSDGYSKGNERLWNTVCNLA